MRPRNAGACIAPENTSRSSSFQQYIVAGIWNPTNILREYGDGTASSRLYFRVRLAQLDTGMKKIGLYLGLSGWLAFGPVRSEERRVGKECRSRWGPYD